MTDDFAFVIIPRQSSNEDEVFIGEWLVKQGDHVQEGQRINRGESAKSVFDILAPASGFFYSAPAGGNSDVPIGARVGIVVREDIGHGAAMALLIDLPLEEKPVRTLKAEILARRREVEVSSGVERLLIVGGGKGAVQVLDALTDQRAVAIVDDDPSKQGTTVFGVPVVGEVSVERAKGIHHEWDAAVISVSTSIAFRARVFKEWREHGLSFTNVIHPSVIVGTDVVMGVGNVLLAFCHIGPCAAMGDNNFLSAYCSIEHHCEVGSHSTFGPGVITSSKVMIEDRVKFGTGVFIQPFLTIGERAIVASGCVLTTDIPKKAIVKSRQTYVIRRSDDSVAA